MAVTGFNFKSIADDRSTYGIAPDDGKGWSDSVWYSNDPTLTLSGVATGPGTIGVWVVGGIYATPTLISTITATKATSGSVAATLPSLADGDYTITFTQGTTAGSTVLATKAVVIDTTIATPDAPDMKAISDNGISDSDNITSKSSVILTGTGEAGATVKIYDTVNGITTLVKAGTIDSAGTYEQIVSGLTAGDHTFTVQYTDLAGNVSTTSSGLTVTVVTDTTTFVSVPDLKAFTDTGVSDHDNITSSQQVILTGTAEANSIVKVYEGATLLKTLTVGSSGVYEFKTTGTLSDGEHTFTATVTDQYGNTASSPGSLTVTVDTHAPTVSDIVVAGNDVIDPSEEGYYTVTGTTDAPVGDHITVSIMNGSSVIETTSLVSDGSGSFSAGFTAAGYPSGTLSVKVSASDAAGNETVVTKDFSSTVCFMAGTLVATPAGEVAVETLKAGDLVLTTEGKAAPVRWLGRQTVSMLFADPLRVLPIRVKAGALDENVPARDLLVSPDHALLVDGVLVQAGALVNGSSIVRDENVPQVFTYFHVELADHSLILAENTPAETFIDNVDRLAFDNWVEHEAIADTGAPLSEMTLPRVKSLRQVPKATRQRLAHRGVELYGHAAEASVA